MVDAAVPFIQGVFEPYAEVVYKAGKQISREDLADVDAMVIRTRTICNADRSSSRRQPSALTTLIFRIVRRKE